MGCRVPPGTGTVRSTVPCRGGRRQRQPSRGRTSGTATYGLDWAVVVVGRHGTVRSSELYQYRAGPGIPWDFVVAVPSAVDTSRLEVSVPASVLNLSAA